MIFGLKLSGLTCANKILHHTSTFIYSLTSETILHLKVTSKDFIHKN